MSNAEYLQPVPISKILVVNGYFYSGIGIEFSSKRTEAVVIESQGELNVLIDAAVHKMIDEGFDLKRIEIINAKEVEDDARLKLLPRL